MALTRREIRNRVARSMHDLLTLTATQGSDNMLVDPIEITDYDNTFAGAQGICVSAASPENVGKVIRVVASSMAGNSISFEPKLPAHVQEGDVFDLVNLRNRGFRLQEYNDAIQGAIKTHAHLAPRPANSEPILFDATDPYVDIPDDWVSIHGVTMVTDGYGEYDIAYGRYDDARGWRPVFGRRIEISGMDAGFCHGYNIILHGMAGHPDVTEDDDLCHLDPKFITLTIQSDLAARRGDSVWNQWAVEWARMAAAAMPAALPSWPVNTVRLDDV